MKSNQVQTRMSWEDIKTIDRLARKAHMTSSAMLRRLVLERLEQIAQTPLSAAGLSPSALEKGEPNENQ